MSDRRVKHIHRPPSRSARRLAGLVLLPTLLVACGDGEARDGPPGGGPPEGGEGRAIPVIGEVASPGDLQITLRGSTTLRARESVEIVPRQAGQVAEILVEEGDRVSEGEALGRLDDEQWVLQAQQARARADEVAGRLARSRSLADQELVSAQEVENLVSDSAVAESERDLAELSVRNSRIVSPIDGVVTHRLIERGQQVGTSEPAFQVADLDRLEARIDVPERDAARIQVGQQARVVLEEDGEPLGTGTVERIRPVVDAESGTVQVTVGVDARREDAQLRPGQFVNVDIVTEQLTGRVTLPRTAVLVDGAEPRVFVVQSGMALEREVVLGHSQGSRVEVAQGVELGDTVVVVGQDNLRPDVQVELMEVVEDPSDTASAGE